MSLIDGCIVFDTLVTRVEMFLHINLAVIFLYSDINVVEGLHPGGGMSVF